MNETEQRIAIAEAHTGIKWKMLPCWCVNENGKLIAKPSGPLNYLESLDAMHEACLGIGPIAVELRKIIVRDMRDKEMDGLIPDFWFYNATAKQRAEAFLRTIGKWKD